MAQLPRPLIEQLKNEFAPRALSVMLTGSFARGEATAYSDVDLIRYMVEPPKTERERYTLTVRQGYLISLTQVTIEEQETDMQKPEKAIMVVPSLRQGQVLYDPRSHLHYLRKKAFDFEWEPLQKAANEYVAEELMGFAEEAHKIISAILTKNESAVVYGSMSLVLAMPRLFAVQQGMMIRSENSLFSQVQEAVGDESNWTKYHRKAMGMDAVAEDGAVFERGRAALSLYRETVAFMGKFLQPKQTEVVQNALNAIKNYGG
jgi:predicted nucleotidyltransferase